MEMIDTKFRIVSYFWKNNRSIKCKQKKFQLYLYCFSY